MHEPSERGAALPLVLLMTVILALSLSATAVLTQSAATTVRSQARETASRAALVSWALQNVTRDLTPATGRLLGVDPRVDPAGSCIGQLGPYTDASGRRVSVDCIQDSDSGLGAGSTSLLLVGNGNDCAPSQSCSTGQDGGLRLTSNDALNFSGTLVNVSGAWQGKNSNSQVLNPTTQLSSVLEPTASPCPAGSGGFVTNQPCTCPLTGTDSSKCYQRTLADLQADVSAYVQRAGSGTDASPTGAAALIPSCSNVARYDSTNPASPWALKITGGTVTSTELAQLNALFDGSLKCNGKTFRVGDGSTNLQPMLVVSGVLRFQDTRAGSAMAASSAPVAANTWTIASSNAIVIAGTPVADPSTGWDCDQSQPGAMLQFAGSSYLRLSAGRLLLCPLTLGGVTLSAPTSEQGAGYAWQGLRNEPLFATQYGQASGEVFRAHGVIFSPAAWFRIESQSNRTQVLLGGGSILRGLTLTSNPSAFSQGDFLAPAPLPRAERRVQLRFWDMDRGRDLGIVELVISDKYPGNPAAGYAFKVWRTMW